MKTLQKLHSLRGSLADWKKSQDTRSLSCLEIELDRDDSSIGTIATADQASFSLRRVGKGKKSGNAFIDDSKKRARMRKHHRNLNHAVRLRHKDIVATNPYQPIQTSDANCHVSSRRAAMVRDSSVRSLESFRSSKSASKRVVSPQQESVKKFPSEKRDLLDLVKTLGLYNQKLEAIVESKVSTIRNQQRKLQSNDSKIENQQHELESNASIIETQQKELESLRKANQKMHAKCWLLKKKEFSQDELVLKYKERVGEFQTREKAMIDTIRKLEHNHKTITDKAKRFTAQTVLTRFVEPEEPIENKSVAGSSMLNSAMVMNGFLYLASFLYVANFVWSVCSKLFFS